VLARDYELPHQHNELNTGILPLIGLAGSLNMGPPNFDFALNNVVRRGIMGYNGNIIISDQE
jgi:hypothetical protein